MKYYYYLFTLIALLWSNKLFAYDIAVENADGITIYYNYINDSKELQVTSGNIKYINDVVIPEEVTYMNRTRKVTNIGEKAFYNNNKLISVIIPDNVTIIEKRAFQNCESLASISIGKSVVTIDECAFKGCSNLQKVIVKDIAAWCKISFIVTSDERASHSNTSNPLSYANHLFSDENTEIIDLIIPNNVTKISQYAFYGCRNLVSVTIPQSVTSINYNAFFACSNLQKVIVKDIAAWCNITFESTDNYLGKYSNPLFIANHLYIDKNTEITDLVIPNNVTKINNWAFNCCSFLTSVKISNSVTVIGDNAFLGCSKLASLNIGNNVNSIGEMAFYECKSLTSVTIPNSVTSIGFKAFYDADIPTVISLIENPFNISSSIFSNNTLKNATLFVPKGTIDKYKATEGWKDFLFIEEGTGGGGGGTTPEKCANPTISYNDGKLTYYCETEGATFQSTITNDDIHSYSSNEVQLTVTYNISVYATKTGYEDSEIVTATLCWIDKEPTTEGITDGVAQISPKAVLIQSEGGILKVEGVDDGTQVAVYTPDGKQAGSAISRNGAALVGTCIQPGNTAIVKIGEKAVKVVIK